MRRTQPDQFPHIVERFRATVWQRIMCALGQHKWVARVDLGGQPDKEMIDKDPVGYFFVFSTPVCEHCPTQLPPRMPDMERP